MTSTVPRRRDADFADLIGQLNRLCDEQKAQVAADRLDARVQRAIQDRACRMLRAYETASTAHHHRHTMTGIPTPPHEAREMERLRADWLEACQQIRECR